MATVKSPKLQGGTGLRFDDLVRFDWQVAVGGVPLTLAELRELARLKQPLVRVRGLWVHVTADEIEAALRFWKEKGGAASVRDVVRMSLGAAEPPGGLAFDGVTATGWVADLLASLQGHAAFASAGDLLQWHPHGHLLVTDGAFRTMVRFTRSRPGTVTRS